MSGEPEIRVTSRPTPSGVYDHEFTQVMPGEPPAYLHDAVRALERLGDGSQEPLVTAWQEDGQWVLAVTVTSASPQPAPTETAEAHGVLAEAAALARLRP